MEKTLKEKILNKIDVNKLLLHFTETQISLSFNVKTYVVRDIAAKQREFKRLENFSCDLKKEKEIHKKKYGEWAKLKKTALYKKIMEID